MVARLLGLQVESASTGWDETPVGGQVGAKADVKLDEVCLTCGLMLGISDMTEGGKQRR
jgi:hypothetical protein